MSQHTLTVQAELEEINRICRLVESSAVEAGFDERSAYAFQLAVCEACENIVVHGYGDKATGKIEALITIEGGELRVELRDTAPPFNPATVEASPPTPPEDPPVGGLGLYILQKVMDEIHYDRRQGQNRLLLTKRRPEAPD
ncbi:MAG TPA: ATP-binding protein [Anaerolineales bacterium]|jgi:anti-sigma regulatory factor (Ser/Thr protein kinase)